MFRSGLSLVVAAALLFFAGCGRRDGNATQTLRISQRNEPADLDPATATLPDEFFIIRALSEGLLQPDPTGAAPRPALADSYNVSTDGLTYTFHLRTAQWSNGEPVTAADFIASYHRVLTPATAAPKADLFFGVKNARAFAQGKISDFTTVGFSAPDPRTLVITLEQPLPRFPYYAASGPWIPVNPRIVAQYQRQWTQPAHFVGNGPFTLAEWRSQQRIVVRKNPRYYAPEKIKVEAIEFLRFDSGETEERAFRAGQVEVTMGIPQSKIETYALERAAELHRTPLAETRFLSFNTHRPGLQDPRVRRALSLAIDRQRLVDRVTRGGQEAATRYLAPELHCGVPPPGDAVAHGFDPELARRLLAEAGVGGANFPKLELSAWSASQSPVIEAIQEMWRRELGLNVSLAIREAKVHLAALAAGNYDIAFVVTLIDVPDPVMLLADFTTGAANNFPHWQSPDYDQAVAAGRQETDLRRQSDHLARAETLLLESGAVAPIYFNAKNWLLSPRVHGWQEDALWTRFYQNVSLDEK